MSRKHYLVSFLVIFSFLVTACSNSSSDNVREQIERRDAAEAEVWNIIDASRSCESDAQCSTEYLGCPFGCGIALNTDKKEAAIKAVSLYHENYSECLYKCLPPVGARCEVNLCVEILATDLP